MRVPRATYRLQFNEHFRLGDAFELVPYLHKLGISHVYASPLFKATPHSTHGYDVCDYQQLNPELGTEADLEKLAAALHEKNMGLVLDIVPNHMGINSPANAWWWDVLANGMKSKFAKHFDIDWRPSDKNLHGKILVPILDDDYESVLKKGGFRLLFDGEQFLIDYHENHFPLAPKTISKLPRKETELRRFNSDFDALDNLLRRQNYQFEFHGRGDTRLNYRRFFAVNSLAAVRVEDEDVFNATHALVRRWIGRGIIDGLRVDHPDGLHDPAQYLKRLRAIAPNAWIVVEKILQRDELLPGTWPVQGTTGYDFLNHLNGLFVNENSKKEFTKCYTGFTGEPADYPALVREKKRTVLKTLFVTEMNRLTHLLAAIAARNRASADMGKLELREALLETIACFPVYRSYIRATKKPTAVDIATIKFALHLACEERKDLAPETFAFIQGMFLKLPRGGTVRDFIARFQQLTGPAMAKGVEDTAFFCFNRFVSLNEVGGAPDRFGVGVGAFHSFSQQQQEHWPHSQLTTSTHDTKHSEDVRARLNVLSEIPHVWSKMIRKWAAMNSCHKRNDLPDRNAEYLYYQTLAGTWPLSVDRAQFYMEKAVLESKQHTSWTNRNAPYEKALKIFVSKTLRDPQFTAELDHFIASLADAAAVNSLAQTLIKLTAPGVPDVYQGCELLDFSLVDPDNRRPVDFMLHRQLLSEMETLSAESVWERRSTGVPKMWLTQKTLGLREKIVKFSDLKYRPLFAQGVRKENIVAFSRGEKLITVVPRFVLNLKNNWQATFLNLPEGEWRNEFTGENLTGLIRVKQLFQKFPVALLVRKDD